MPHPSKGKFQRADKRMHEAHRTESPITCMHVMYLPGRIRICGKPVLPGLPFCEEHFKRR